MMMSRGRKGEREKGKKDEERRTNKRSEGDLEGDEESAVRERQVHDEGSAKRAAETSGKWKARDEKVTVRRLLLTSFKGAK